MKAILGIPQIVRGGEIIQKGEWEAHSRLDNPAATGPTPDEAVARLWLALHKHGDATA
jgi:hypothetical protein